MEAQVTCSDRMKSLSILVADDEKDIRLLLQEWLVTAGHTVVMAGSGREACDAVRRKRFDLVVTDVLMPEGDGIDLITEIRRTQRGVRILAISGGGRYTDGRDYLDLARGLGAHAVVLKPFTWEQVSAGIETALATAVPVRA